MTLADRTAVEICELVAAGTPVPGGGSVSALAGAMSASLVAMVARINQRKANAELINQFAALSARADQLGRRLLELADHDARAYDAVVAARRLPRTTEQEVASRARAIERAAEEAASVPMETARLGRELMLAAQDLLERGSPVAHSDALVAERLARVAVEGGLANVAANLPDVAEEARGRLSRELEQISGSLPGGGACT